MTIQPLSRRGLFRASLILAAGAAAVGCAAEAPPAPRPTPTPTPPPLSAPTSRPATVRSYGPNGTHFPEELPWPGETAPTDLVALCDWRDIARKVQGLTAAQVAAGVIIRVEPGELSGGGWGSSSTPVLASVGDQSWERNVLIIPRDGYGSVTIATAGARFEQCARLSLFGFESAGGFVLTRCVSLQIGWSRFDAMSITRGGRDIALYELVLGFRRNAEDTAAVRPTETYEMTNISRHGCVFGPSVKPAGSDAHCDTIQLESTGSGPFGPFLTYDSVDYGSSNAAELLQDKVSLAEYHHSLILGGLLPWRVYPLQAGDYEGDPNAFSGGCRDVRLFDSAVSGAVGRMGFTQIENTTLSYEPVATQQPSESGSWTVDTAMAGWTAADIMGLQSIPDYERTTLQSIWAW